MCKPELGSSLDSQTDDGLPHGGAAVPHIAGTRLARADVAGSSNCDTGLYVSDGVEQGVRDGDMNAAGFRVAKFVCIQADVS